jgi:hypothetical protein
MVTLLAAAVFSLVVTSAALAALPPTRLVEYDFENVAPNQGVSVPAPPSFWDGFLVNVSDFSIVQGSGVSLLNTLDRDGVVPGNQMSFEQGIPAFSSVEPWEYNSFQFAILAASGTLQVTSVAFAVGHNDADNPTTQDGIIEYWRDGRIIGSDTFNITDGLSPGKMVGIVPVDLVLTDLTTTFKVRFNQKVYGVNSFTTQFRIDNVVVYGVPITKPQIYSPNGGELVRSGGTYDIKWGAPEEAVRFDLKYSSDNGATWSKIGSGLPDTTYPWIVPTPKNNQTKCLVKVIGYDINDKKVGEDTSDAPFTIEVVRLDFPNGGTTYSSNTLPSIEWTTNVTKNNVDKVILYYTLNGGSTWVKIATITGNPGSFSTWQIPKPPAEAKSKCKVKVVLKNKNGDTIGSDVSDSEFTIIPIP